MQNKSVFIYLFTSEKWISVAVNIDDGSEMESESVKVVGENSSSDAEDIDVEPWLNQRNKFETLKIRVAFCHDKTLAIVHQTLLPISKLLTDAI